MVQYISIATKYKRTKVKPDPLSLLYSQMSSLDVLSLSEMIIRPAFAVWGRFGGLPVTICSTRISARDQFLQPKLIHCVYYTPQRLAIIYPNMSHMCLRCSTKTGTYLHIFWSCPNLQHYWREVVDTINAVGNLSLPLEPAILLLGLTDLVEATKHEKLFILFTAYYTRRKILLKLKSSDPPPIPTPPPNSR